MYVLYVYICRPNRFWPNTWMRLHASWLKNIWTTDIWTKCTVTKYTFWPNERANVLAK